MRITSGGTVLVNRTSNAVSGAKFSINGMSEFETTLTNNEDWQNSPISIGERGNVGSGQTANKYAPNLNFHWSGVTSKSLWLGADGHLSFGEYLSDGTPTADGTFLVNTIGIGTTSPGAKLHTKVGTSGGSPYDSSVGIFAEGGTRSIIQMSSTSDAYLMFGDASVNNQAWFGYNHANNQLLLHTGGSITMDGNVGIGTTSPTENLHVKTGSNTTVLIEGNQNTRFASLQLKNASQLWVPRLEGTTLDFVIRDDTASS
jgi:hypothetical protein